MSTLPAKRRSRPARIVEGEVVDVPAPVVKSNEGFIFRYSYAEFSAVGRSARLKAKHVRFEDGKLTTESFEGEVDPRIYERAINDAQSLFAGQTALHLRAWRSFLAPFPKG